MKINITKNRLKKCLVLFLIANLGFGVQLAYSSPSSLASSFLNDIGMSESQFGLLFTFYSAPNMYMVILGGILIDIVGTNKVSTIFCLIAILSSFITTLSSPNYKGLLIGRFLLGSGGEMLLSCAATMVPMWFKKDEVPLCMGFLSSWIYWGNLTALLVLPRIRAALGLKAAFWFITAVFVFAFILNGILIKFGKQLRWNDNKETEEDLETLTTSPSTANTTTIENSNTIEDGTLKLNSRVSSSTELDSEDRELQEMEIDGDSSSSGGEGDSSSSSSRSSSNGNDDDINNNNNIIGNEVEDDHHEITLTTRINIIDQQQTVKIKKQKKQKQKQQNNNTPKHIEYPKLSVKEFKKRLGEIKDQSKKLSKRFWMLVVICFFGYFVMFGFAVIGTDVLKTKFGYDEETSATYMAAEAVVNSTLPVAIGWCISNVRGRKIQLMAFASFLLGLGVLLLNVTNVNPLPWIIMCGVGFSLLNTTLMSCVPLLADMSIVGTAYALVSTAYNCNIMIFPPILDAIKQETHSYTIPLAILSFSSVVTICLLGVLKIWDLKVPLSQSLDSPNTTIHLQQSTSSTSSTSTSSLVQNENGEDEDEDNTITTPGEIIENNNSSILV